ncbi:MAG: peptidoglycan DD-metalloendopeptidase family protein [Spirochaetales bacterium]
MQSYADEGVHAIAVGFKGGFMSAAKRLSGIPKAISKGARLAFTAQAKAKARRINEEAPIEPVALDPGLAESEVISASGPASRLGGRTRFLASLAKLQPAVIRAPRIAIFAIIAVAAVSAGAAAIIGATSFPVAPGSLLLPDEDSVQAALIAYLEPDSAAKEDLPSGTLPPIPVSVSIRSYTVKSGDTLEKIAKRFGLRQDTLISSNNLKSASSIHSGVQLRIPNMDGVSHTVRSGESLSSLAKTYAIDVTRIVDANDLASGMISKGQSLFIPNARLSSASLRDFYGERFLWPARGRISSPFGYRANPFTGLRTYHSAIDIVVSLGTKVKATSEGRVADTGYNSVFGNYIILKHASGYQSLYAHLSSILVKEGASVAQGAVIGLSGNTGQSTGPHLHFSIFKNGQALDPTKYVK